MFQGNKDYFPTPIDLARKMLDKLPYGWKREIKYVLEPSAGSGNLIEHYKSIWGEGVTIDGRYYKGNDNPCNVKFDAVEIDDRLVNILRGKGINVVHNDFLTYKPNRYYDLIFCNLPFSDCEHHLLKCIEIQGRIGGKIIAITSASILKNTYSKTRQELALKLEKLNADIEYVQDGFIDAERSTGVEIAIIYIDIPLLAKETMFERDFKRDNHDMKFEEFNSVAIKRNKLEQLVFEYQLIIDSTTKLFEEKLRIDKLLNGFGLQNKISIANDLTRAEKITVNDFIESTNQLFWDKFIEETKFSDRLPSKLKDKFRSNMQKQKNISFNLENVRYFYEELMKEIPESYEETVAKVFKDITQEYAYTGSTWDKTIRYYNSWKTNKSYCVSKRAIIPCYNDGYMYNLPRILVDLNIIFNNITGIQYDITNDKKVLDEVSSYGKKIDTEHFILDSYKKPSLHITFKDSKALAVFNLLAGKGIGWLKGDFDNKPYEDMSDEEKEIVITLGFEPCDFNKMQLGKQDYLRLL